MSDTQHLEESMSDLRAQIAALHPDDEETRNHLSGLVGHLDRRLATSVDPNTADDLGENLNASVLRFEGVASSHLDHPQPARREAGHDGDLSGSPRRRFSPWPRPPRCTPDRR